MPDHNTGTRKQWLAARRSQLLVCHFMFGPDYTAGCPACSAIADGFNGVVVHLANHDVMLWAVSRAPLAKLQAYKHRMGWSSRGRRRSAVTSTTTSRPRIPSSRNGRASPSTTSARSRRAGGGRQGGAACRVGGHNRTDWSAYARGVDGLWGMYQWLDRAPRGRNEARTHDVPLNWVRRHDEYDSE